MKSQSFNVEWVDEVEHCYFCGEAFEDDQEKIVTNALHHYYNYSAPIFEMVASFSCKNGCNYGNWAIVTLKDR
jgi:hypothetical protein